jgi:16S rRNA (adenine1518-N6/adenine1519-N6)-dimethyltransferase
MKTAHQHIPRKRFGQHFLHDPGVIQKIIHAIAPQRTDHMVEIGPGQGALTYPLLERLDALHVVEIDRDLAAYLQSREIENLQVHTVDALRFDFCSLAHGSRLRVVGNLPYNISTPILFHLMKQLECIQDMYFMLQKEVVERMVAAPGSRDYGRLSIMVQYRCDVESLFDIGPGAFKPPPRVDSSLVRLTPHTQAPAQVNDERLFEKLVTQAFSARRKTLRNALKNLLEPVQIEACGIDPGLRPEQLSLRQFACLCNQVIVT